MANKPERKQNEASSPKVFTLLLVIAWLTVLFFVVYPFLRHGTTPSLWLLLTLIVIPLLTISHILKIGNFFYFSKSEPPPQHPNTKIEQQINIPVLGQDFADAIIKSISKNIETQKIEHLNPLENKYSKSNTFGAAIDIVLLNSLPIIIAYYSMVTSKIRGYIPAESDDVLKRVFSIPPVLALYPEDEIDYTAVLLLIKIIKKNIKSISINKAEKLTSHFNGLEKLFKLRNSVTTKTDELTSNVQIQDTVSDAAMDVGYLSGYMIGNWVDKSASTK